MLVLTRKNQERVLIGRDIEVTVLKIHGNRVKLGIKGPPNVVILRGDLAVRGSPLLLDTDLAQAAPAPSLDDGKVADLDLERRVSNFLSGLDLPGLGGLEVVVRDGTVVISGRVTSFYHKQIATSCCQRVAGVVHVLNEVQVANSHGMSAKFEDGH